MARRQGGTLSGFTPLSTPNAPTIDSVSTSIGSASVSFTAPSDTGDAAVTSYIVTAVDESTGVSSGVTGTSSPISISPGGGTFKIRMQAVNGFGPGRLSEYDTGNVILSGTELYAFGANGEGRLGINSTTSTSSPVQVGALTTWAQVSSGFNFSAAITTSNALWAWGAGNDGQLGDNSVANRSSPVQVGALTNWQQVSAGRTSCAAVKTDNTLWTWGTAINGELGSGNTIKRSSPVQVGSLTNWAQVSAGEFHMSAVKTDGTLWTWGYGGFGALGNGSTTTASSPVQVGALTNWSQTTASLYSTSAIKSTGTLWSWGRNNYGQLGDNTVIDKSSPVQVGALTTWAQTERGAFHIGAVKTDGTLWTWGYNGEGRLGDGTSGAGERRSSPVQIGALTDWSAFSGGSSHSIAVKTDGTLWGWGDGGSGQLGINLTGVAARRSSPVQVGALTDWVQASAGGTHTLALLGVL